MTIEQIDREAADNFFGSWPRVSIPSYLPGALAQAFAAHRIASATSREAVDLADDMADNAAMWCRRFDEAAVEIERLQARATSARNEALEEAARLCWRRADDYEHAPRAEYDDHRAVEHGRCIEARALEIAINRLKTEGEK